MDEVQLDAKDKKILYQLDVNARQPLSKIAKKVGLSQEVVSYRIKNLERLGVIEGYYAAIDVTKLGYMYCRVLIKYENISLEQEREVLRRVKSLPYVGWFSRNDGRWDLAIIVLAKAIADFEEAYDDMRFQLGKYFQETIVSIAFKIYHLRNNYLFGTKDFTPAVLGEQAMVTYDETDTKILELLSKNARTPILDIARVLGVAPNTVKNRIKKLLKQRIIIALKAKINTAMLGYEHYKVFLMLQNMNEQKQTALISYLQYNPNVVYITKAFGIADLEFEVMLKGKNALYDFMRTLREKFADVIKGYESLLIYEEPLISYLPSTLTSATPASRRRSTK
ncbi:AsnC family transcriptional regulator [Candidatus Woesearchaeota archaeon]|nr:AsnC family transcriptional regulator [Candidatus Woesearchaeota archaeon]